MRFVSPLLKHAVYPALHFFGWLDHMAPPAGYAVVNYHGVIPPDHSSDDIFLDGNLVRQEAFQKQLQFLKAHYNIIHPEEFREYIEYGKAIPRRALLVTCDDGLANTLTEMLPVLQSENIACLFFVTAASCGDNPGMLWYEELYNLMLAKPLVGSALRLPTEDGPESASSGNLQAQWWCTVRRASRLDARARARWMNLVRSHCGPTQTSHSERRWRLLTVNELSQLAEAGMTIGAHTISHPILSLCSEEESRSEIKQSKIDLENALGRRVWAFAYPFGNAATMGEREFRLAQEAGYSCAFLNVEHWADKDGSDEHEDNEHGGDDPSHPFKLHRTHVTRDTTMPEFAAHLSGLHTRLQRVAGG